MATGCATYGVQEFAAGEQSRLVSRNAINSSELSHMTRRYLISEGLQEKCDAEPLICILDIDTEIRSTGNMQLAVYAAEIAFLAARSYDTGDPTFARLNASALVYASGFLFEQDRPILKFHPSHQLAMDLYNRSLAQLLRYLHTGRSLTSSIQRIPLMRGSLELETGSELHYLPRSFLHIKVAYDYRALGFRNHQSYYGLGTPLIVVRPYVDPEDATDSISAADQAMAAEGSPAAREGHSQPDYRYLGRADQAYPATAIFEHDGSYFRSDRNHYSARLRFLDSMKQDRILLHGRETPLEIDLTSPMAYTLSGVEKSDSLLRRLDGDSIGETSGLYMLYPYDPDKIPVVFVHGLASSPMTWFPMINELLADPEIRQRYQFWVYWYPTSNPVEFSAQGLRSTLKRARERFDFQHLLLIGHSMGGLLSRLMIQTSNSEDWIRESGIERERFQKLDEESLTLLRSVTEYEPLPFVDRVIFLATPHRGSALADGLAGYMGRKVMSVPSGLASILGKGLELLGAEEDEASLAPPSGIESLSPDSLFVRVTMKQPFAPVPYHSIIGSRSATDLDWITDSVVPYSSAHLPGAASELLVESDHSVQLTMPAILEVRRILRLHLDQGAGLKQAAAISIRPGIFLYASL
ncbi:MAG: alpha/beta hydrolase [Leptospiraceae bacterium]|nr:alpha/beta hydrolase [Leptospiraceae bacterium]